MSVSSGGFLAVDLLVDEKDKLQWPFTQSLLYWRTKDLMVYLLIILINIFNSIPITIINTAYFTSVTYQSLSNNCALSLCPGPIGYPCFQLQIIHELTFVVCICACLLCWVAWVFSYQYSFSFFKQISSTRSICICVVMIREEYCLSTFYQCFLFFLLFCSSGYSLLVPSACLCEKNGMTFSV